MTNIEELTVLEGCTLPTIERPLRLAEFDDLFSTALTAQTRLSAGVLRWSLDPRAEALARDLAARESQCCSFFTFTFTSDGDTVQMDVRVPAVQSAVLDALAARAAARMSTP
ncbi:MAG TPA: hypothetical protein VNT27_05350 [Propionibacteriaceae bacterium]|nr:hypothetical protein [Propionibacteriaceae bacterium]